MSGAASEEPSGSGRRRAFWLSGRGLVSSIPYLWLLLFFLLPFAIVLKISLAEPIIAQPPFTPLFGPDGSLQARSEERRVGKEGRSGTPTGAEKHDST